MIRLKRALIPAMMIVVLLMGNTAKAGVFFNAVELGTSPNVPGYLWGNIAGASAINANGQVVGYVDKANYVGNAVLWQSGAVTPIDLGLNGIVNGSLASGINDSVQVV